MISPKLAKPPDPIFEGVPIDLLERMDEFEKCPNCHETNERWIEHWPRTGLTRGPVGGFYHRRCLSCGQYFSVWKNYQLSLVKR